jgi:Phosphopantetheinyl transferase
MPLHIQPYPMIGIWKTDESVDQLLTLLDKTDEYLPFLEQCKSESRKIEWLATRATLKALLGDEAIISYHPNGAPFLKDSPYSISISHTKGYVAVMLTEGKTAGIDIEHISERARRTQRRFINEQEAVSIDNDNEINHLLIHWCAKETLFKIISQEEVDFLKHLHVEPFPYSTEGVLDVYETRTSSGNSFQFEYRVTPEFVLVFCI